MGSLILRIWIFVNFAKVSLQNTMHTSRYISMMLPLFVFLPPVLSQAGVSSSTSSVRCRRPGTDIEIPCPGDVSAIASEASQTPITASFEKTQDNEIDQCLIDGITNDQEASDKCLQAIKKAGLKAFEYLKKQMADNNGVFIQDEGAAGVLGILAGTRSYENDRRWNRLIAGKSGHLLSSSVAVDFLNTLRRIEREHPESSQPLQHLDYTSLLQYMGVIRAFCLEHKNYHGYNLYEEVERRLSNENEPFEGGLILSLCNTKHSINRRAVAKLLNGKSSNVLHANFTCQKCH